MGPYTRVGLDYSMTGPAITICNSHNTNDFHIDNCLIYFMTDTKRYQGGFCNSRIIGQPLLPWKTDMERYDMISDFFMGILHFYKETEIKMMIEGYAMGARGLVFHIGENTGIIKHKLFKQGISFDVMPPTRVKKLATGVGNADKNMMYDSFVKETGIDLRKELCYTKTDISSPIGDIVDSYYICKALNEPK